MVKVNYRGLIKTVMILLKKPMKIVKSLRYSLEY